MATLFELFLLNQPTLGTYNQLFGSSTVNNEEGKLQAKEREWTRGLFGNLN